MKTNDIRCLLWTSMCYLLAMSTTSVIHADDHEHEHDHDHEHAAEVIAIHLPGGRSYPLRIWSWRSNICVRSRRWAARRALQRKAKSPP